MAWGGGLGEGCMMGKGRREPSGVAIVGLGWDEDRATGVSPRARVLAFIISASSARLT